MNQPSLLRDKYWPHPAWENGRLRRAISSESIQTDPVGPLEQPALLKKWMADHAATGLPSAFLPKEENSIPLNKIDIKSLYGLKYNPFLPSVPKQALYSLPGVETFELRVGSMARLALP